MVSTPLSVQNTAQSLPVAPLAQQLMLLQADMDRVKHSLKQIVPPQTQVLQQTVAHALQGGGKLLRPMVSLLAAGVSGAIDSPHIENAAVAELIHVATLLHDDVLDDADTRRGRETVRAKWDNKVAILSGDYLLAQASWKLSQLNNCRLVSIYAKVLGELCDGEIEQMQSSFQLNVSWDKYFNKTVWKTASLFASCCEAAGVINQLDEPLIQNIRRFGEQFGVAFQIVDDLLDYTATAEKLGKPVLDDLKNGIVNAPILLALQSLENQPEKRQLLLTRVESWFSLSPQDAERHVIEQQLLVLLNETQAIEQTQALAMQYAQEAKQALQPFAASDYKLALEQLLDFALTREY